MQQLYDDNLICSSFVPLAIMAALLLTCCANEAIDYSVEPNPACSYALVVLQSRDFLWVYRVDSIFSAFHYYFAAYFLRFTQEKTRPTCPNSDTQIERFCFAIGPPYSLELKPVTSGAIRHLKIADIKHAKC